MANSESKLCPKFNQIEVKMTRAFGFVFWPGTLLRSRMFRVRFTRLHAHNECQLCQSHLFPTIHPMYCKFMSEHVSDSRSARLRAANGAYRSMPVSLHFILLSDHVNRPVSNWFAPCTDVCKSGKRKKVRASTNGICAKTSAYKFIK